MADTTFMALVRRSPAVAASASLLSALAAEKAAEDRFCAASTACTDGPLGCNPALRPAMSAAADAHKAAVRTLMATPPVVPADILLLIDRFEAITDGSMIEAEQDGLTALLATVRAFVSREA